MSKQLLAVLAEGFDGPSDTSSYFLDGGADAGLRATLASLTPEEASHSWGGNSVAAHAHHILFGLEASAAWIAGDRSGRDWGESWRVSTVDAASWAKLQEDLGSRYGQLRSAIETHTNGNPETIEGAIGALAHVAYHIGAIRQKIAASRVI